MGVFPNVILECYHYTTQPNNDDDDDDGGGGGGGGGGDGLMSLQDLRFLFQDTILFR
jgi:hypothetical protein